MRQLRSAQPGLAFVAGQRDSELASNSFGFCGRRRRLKTYASETQTLHTVSGIQPV
jgi:hypothetical protein